MEVKEVERAVITKPVASKPSRASFRSFSELLAGASNASPPAGITRSNTAVAAIRPKTVRAQPLGEVSETAPTSLGDNIATVAVGKSPVLYKPLAKVVSKATVSLLASMFNQEKTSITHQQAPAQVEAHALQMNKSNQLNVHPPLNTVTQYSEKSQQIEPPEEPKLYTAAANVDRSSYDGYNWRKYGQKQVKGSEYPRSYYKCTHPNCPVKKKVERSFNGQIVEIVYKGEHNHPKPPPKRSSLGAQGKSLTNEGARQDQDTYNPNKSHIPLSCDPGTIGVHGTGGGTPDSSCGRSAYFEEGEEPGNKRRKSGVPTYEVGTSGDGIQDPRISVQSAPETEIIGDGFRWRKYGQKIVKGIPYPRSYYKCTSLNCSVRKYVERASDETRAFITTYEGKHNHDIPRRMANSAAHQSDLRPPMNKKS